MDHVIHLDGISDTLHIGKNAPWFCDKHNHKNPPQLKCADCSRKSRSYSYSKPKPDPFWLDYNNCNLLTFGYYRLLLQETNIDLPQPIIELMVMFSYQVESH